MSRLTQNKLYNLPVNYNELGYTERRVVRQQYIKEQNNKCFYCKNNIYEQPDLYILNKKINWSLFPKNFLESPIHLQHCHKTGMTEGAIHSYCNAILWCYHGK